LASAHTNRHHRAGSVGHNAQSCTAEPWVRTFRGRDAEKAPRRAPSRQSCGLLREQLCLLGGELVVREDAVLVKVGELGELVGIRSRTGTARDLANVLLAALLL